MWIRSQDKMKLVDVVAVRGHNEVNYCGEPAHIIGYSSAGYSMRLGEYATKERVEEVINEITDAILNYRSTVNDGQGYTMPALPVFIMPID